MRRNKKARSKPIRDGYNDRCSTFSSPSSRPSPLGRRSNDPTFDAAEALVASNAVETYPSPWGEGKGEGDRDAATARSCVCKSSNLQSSSKAERAYSALPVKPAFCNAFITSNALKSPVTSNESAPLVAVLPVTPGTDLSALSTALTHLAQQRCTPLMVIFSTFASFAPDEASSLTSLLSPK